MSYNPFDDLPEAVKEVHGVPEQRAPKRRKVVESDVAECKEDDSTCRAHIKTEDKESPQQPKKVDVASTLQTLRKHIFISKKQTKVLQLLLNLTESELNETNCKEFFHILNDFFAAEHGRELSPSPHEAMSVSTATAADKLINHYFSQQTLFCNTHRFQLQNWFLLYSVRNSLCCDDSFRFSRACQVVAELFDCEMMFPAIVTADYTPHGEDNNTHGEDNNTHGEDNNTGEGQVKKEEEEKSEDVDQEGSPGAALKRDRTAATLACMDAALPLYTRNMWAKQPLDKLFATVAQHRLQVPTDQREQLDDLTTKITLARRKAISGKPTQTVRSFNSTAHPLQTKKTGLLR